MNSYINALSSISVIVILILLISTLRYFKLLKKEDGVLFSKIVTHITLPAVIFTVLSQSKALEWEYVLVVVLVLAVESILLFIAWVIGKHMGIERAKLGVLMLVSAFGSSALLGYAIIGQLFPSNIKALSEAVLISELGVGMGIFTLGTMVAIYFGSGTLEKQSPLQSIILFIKSPIFMATFVGLGYSALHLPTQIPVIQELFEALDLIAKSNTFFIALTVGVLLEFKDIRSILSLVFIVILLKLVLSPILLWMCVASINLTSWQLEIILLEAAMPSAMLSVVLAQKYGCDAQLASKLVFITTLFSVFSTTVLIGFL
ncbi:MAG: AEC family transporter [Campylobacterota bacterium]|nr:AEC family transporter [Campylobacterota bacterium]